MKVINIPIKDLKPAEYNPRGLTKKEREDLQASLDEFGMVEPIVVNTYEGRENIIIGGHQRYYLEKDKGKETIPAVQVSLPQDKEKELNLRLNKNNGHWEWELLKEFDETLLKAVGFSEDELSEAFKKVNREAQEDDAPAANEGVPPDSKPGVVYELGEHRLMCGDATKIEDVKKLVGSVVPNMVFTDPPYNVDYTGKTKDSLKIENDKFEDSDFYQFLLDAFVNMASVVEGGTPIYVCHADSEGINFRKAFVDAGFLMKQCIIWAKNSLVMGRQDYQWKHEPILYGWKDGGTHKWYGGRNQTTLWEIDRPTKSTDHPTMKPLALISVAINNSSKENDVILDPFGGSGSTLAACEQLDRVCYTMELDPKYCDVIRKRYANLIGEGDKWELATPPAKD